LLDDLLVAEDARAEEGMVGDVVEPLSSMADLSTPSWKARTATAQCTSSAAYFGIARFCGECLP
jgi:hypothetical protein